jgi:hypothetical protein
MKHRMTRVFCCLRRAPIGGQGDAKRGSGGRAERSGLGPPRPATSLHRRWQRLAGAAPVTTFKQSHFLALSFAIPGHACKGARKEYAAKPSRASCPTD